VHCNEALRQQYSQGRRQPTAHVQRQLLSSVLPAIPTAFGGSCQFLSQSIASLEVACLTQQKLQDSVLSNGKRTLKVWALES
jgi:hypothetical protein